MPNYDGSMYGGRSRTIGVTGSNRRRDGGRSGNKPGPKPKPRCACCGIVLTKEERDKSYWCPKHDKMFRLSQPL